MSTYQPRAMSTPSGHIPFSTGHPQRGAGRADVRVFDESGNPIRNAYVKLESTRSDGFFCESWNNTDEHGLAGLPPLHMGSLKLKVKAKGYRTQELEVLAADLGNPVRVTLKKK